MEFRLVYDGRLPAAGRSETRNADKDRIRRVLSKQLAELSVTHPAIKRWHEKNSTGEQWRRHIPDDFGGSLRPDVKYSLIDVRTLKYQRFGLRYVPLLTGSYSETCSLDILFLRRDQPGSLIMSGGDLDNRLKVLFDALRLPQHADEALESPDGSGDDPVYVLLEDDNLIVDVKVNSDRLLTPRADGEHQNDVRLIVHVKTIIQDASKWGALVLG